MATHLTNPDRKLGLNTARKETAEPVGQEIRNLQFGTRSAIRHLFVFVGGTGLETLDAMAPVLKAHGIGFGDEGLADTKGIVPYAIFVDTNTQETKMVQAVDDMSKEEKARIEREGRLIRDVQGMGVVTCDLYERTDILAAKLRKLRIAQKTMTTDAEISTDSHGAKTDSRISKLLLLAKRKEKNDSNPVHLAREIAEGWRDPHKKTLDNTVFLTVVGGAHGGTGPLALPLSVDIREALADVLSGTKSNLVSERFIMTSESAGRDESVKQDEQEQRRRMLNTAVTLISSNYAQLTGKYAMTPTDHVSMGFKTSPKHYEFIVGGDNGTHHVSSQGGHYEPTRVIGKVLASRLIATDPTSGLRANVDKYLEDGRNPKKCVHNQVRGFSSLGVSELVPDPERKVLSKARKQLLFAEALGITIPDDVVQYAEPTSLAQNETGKEADKHAQTSTLFPKNNLSSKKNELKTAMGNMVVMRPPYYWEGETSVEAAVSSASRKRANKLPALTTRLDAIVNDTAKRHATELMDGVMGAVSSLKERHGLNTAIAFLEKISEGITSLANESLNDAKQAEKEEKVKEQESTGILDDIEAIKLPSSGFGKLAESFTNAVGLSDPQARQQQISSKLDQLAASDNQLLGFKSENMYCTRFARMLSTVVISVVDRYVQDLKSQKLRAETILNTIEADPETTVVSTPFDVPESVDMQIDAKQANVVRSKYLQRKAKDHFNPETDGDPYPWNEQDMQSVSSDSSIRLQPSDINLVQKLQQNGAALLEKLEADSSPLSCSASRASKGQSPGYQHPIVMITKPAADRTAMALIPSPASGGTDIRVPSDGAYSIIREHHAFGLIDDKYVRECVKTLLETPPTAVEARKLAEIASLGGGDGSELDFISREELFLFKGESQQLLPSVFEALAKREKAEDGDIGDTPKCANKNNCGVMFYRTPEEKDAGVNHCPGCRQIFETE